MTYGIRVIGKDTAGNNYTVIDSSDVSTRSLGPAPNAGGLFTSSADNRASITASFASPTALPNSAYTAGDLVFARPQDNVARLEVDSRPSIPVFHTNSHYISARASNDLTSNVNGATYGILIKNSAGTPVVALDSRKINSSVEVLKSWEKGSRSGGQYDASNSAYLAANLLWDGASISQTADQFKNTYVTIGGSFLWSTSGGGSTEVMKQATFIFDHTNKKIYYEGYYSKVITTHFGSSTFLAFGNQAQIIIGEFKA